MALREARVDVAVVVRDEPDGQAAGAGGLAAGVPNLAVEEGTGEQSGAGDGVGLADTAAASLADGVELEAIRGVAVMVAVGVATGVVVTEATCAAGEAVNVGVLVAQAEDEALAT